MCSIAGSEIYNEGEESKVVRMLDVMKHRAPDGWKVGGDRKFAIGMGRLAIIDLESKGLCLYHEDGVFTVFNGEIYNYIEIRKELQDRGHIFITNSDIEVLYKSYKEWGAKCLDKFNGMFAFAIYDGKTIFLARDIAGQKPLYYKENPFQFASEAKALGFECKEFPPATYAIYDFKELKFKKWWDFTPREIDMPYAEEELEWLLEDAVRLCTRADVPYGLYYSSGVDSSLIATFHDFTERFTYEEGDYKEEFLELLPKILWHLDYPINSFSPFGLWKLAEIASKKVKVVLSGEGADELFGGYVRFVPSHFNYEAQKKFPSYKDMFQKAESVHKQGWREFQGNMRELLRMGDRMASAFGIENRCPYLDRRIIEFAFSMPMKLKIQGLDTKIILNRILKKRNPEYQPIEKKGLYVPIGEWLGQKDKYDKAKWLELQKSLWNTQALS